MITYSITPKAMLKSVVQHRHLIISLARHEIIARYRGSVFGMLWSFLNPIFMLAVYTFVFSVVFKARWGMGVSGSRAEFALMLFAGLLVFNLFAECISSAPSLIISNTTYVKKVVFPLEILPWVSLGSALFNAAIGFFVWLVFSLFVFGLPPLSMLLMPIVLLPLLLFIVGLSWFLASLGVYLRDVSQVVGIVVTALMFLTPIFYPLSAIPKSYHIYIYLNPLTFIVEQVRNLLVFGQGLDLVGYVLLTMLSFLVAWLGYVWFQKTRKGFADVL